MSTMPPFPIEDTDALVKLSKAHESVHLVNKQFADDREAAIKAVEQKHAPFLYAAQSVLYEAMRNASLQGFDTEELQQAMGCSSH
jgi:hypothetical protein